MSDNDTDANFEPTKRNWRSFWSLLLMQTQNAFNDKAVQFLLICTANALIYNKVALSGTNTFFAENMQYLLGAIIVTPFILFSPLAGWVGDRFPKSTIIKFSSLFQIGVFLLLVGAMISQSLPLLVVSFFLLAIQSSILSPAKIGVIKELVGKRKLGYASGMLEMFTILGILGGTIIMSHWYGARLGEPMSAWEALRFPVFVLLACTPIAVLGAFMIEKTEAKGGREFKPTILVEHFQQVGSLLKRRELRLSALAVTYFWIFGGFIQLLSIQIADKYSGASAVGLGPDLANMMLVAGVGIALGSVIASLISKRRIELGLVPVGGGIMSFACIAMALCQPLSFSFMAWMFISGLGAAFFLVPVNAFLQDSCEESERGNVIAANNLLNCLGGILAVVVQALMYKKLNLSAPIQLIFLGLLSFVATAYATRLLPKHVVRFVMLMLVRVVYRIRIEKESNMPKSGGVLLVPNHISYLDAFIISAASPREVRFLMFDEYFKKGWMVWFLKMFNTVPISKDRAKEAIQVAADAVSAGDVVCIFPEGQLSRTGTLNEIKRGFEMIARKAKCPVQPVYMDGLWGSIFSFERGKFIYKWPYRLQYGVTVVFGETIEPKQATNVAVRHSLLGLGSEAMVLRDSVVKTQALAKHKAHILEGDETVYNDAYQLFQSLETKAQQRVVLNALQIADGPAFVIGNIIAIDTRVVGDAAMVLLHALPLVNKHKVILISDDSDALEVARKAEQYKISAWLGGSELWELCDSYQLEGLRYDISNNMLADAYFWFVKDGFVVAMNMPDPDAETATQQKQYGVKEASLGRLLPGYFVENNQALTALREFPIDISDYELDEVGFLFNKA